MERAFATFGVAVVGLIVLLAISLAVGTCIESKQRACTAYGTPEPGYNVISGPSLISYCTEYRG